MADIFVSYASEDRARIVPLVEALESAGYSVWWDGQLKGGTRFSAEIESEVRNAGVVLVAWSPNSIRSRWVADEADLALETGNLLPISLDGARSPMGFRQLQTIDFSGWAGGQAPCLDDLLEALLLHTQDGTRTPNEAVPLPRSNKIVSDASIAVLPFVNMSSDPEQEFFSDGISEELLNLLSKIKELTVIARTSSFKFKNTDKDIKEIGAILQVAYLLEGSVRRAGNRVRITAQLIETANASHLWSETYDRTLDDIFAVQDEISAAIVAELKGHILGGESLKAPRAERSSDVGAYEHYMLGQQFLRERTRGAIEKGKMHFEKAMAADPSYAPALVGLADATLLLSDDWTCYGSTPLQQALSSAKPLLDQALQLSPDLPEAHGILSLYYVLGNQAVLGRDSAQRAIDLNPNYSRGYTLLSNCLTRTGDPYAPLFSIRRKAFERDPASLISVQALFGEQLFRGDEVSAKASIAQLEALETEPFMSHFCQAQLALASGATATALSHLLRPKVAFQNSMSVYLVAQILVPFGYGRQLEALQPDMMFECYTDFGMIEDAERLAPQIIPEKFDPGDYETALTVADYYSRKGQDEKAFEILSQFDDPDPDSWGIHFSRELGYYGAILSLHLRRRLGKKASFHLYLQKMKEIYKAMRDDPDGALWLTNYIGAVIAVNEDDHEGAIGFLEQQLATSMRSVLSILREEEFRVLKGNPQFDALKKAAETQNEAERKKAEEAGLLPISEELLKRLASD